MELRIAPVRLASPQCCDRLHSAIPPSVVSLQFASFEINSEDTGDSTMTGTTAGKVTAPVTVDGRLKHLVVAKAERTLCGMEGVRRGPRAANKTGAQKDEATLIGANVRLAHGSLLRSRRPSINLTALRTTWLCTRRCRGIARYTHIVWSLPSQHLNSKLANSLMSWRGR
jgi:hypothetical protein